MTRMTQIFYFFLSIYSLYSIRVIGNFKKKNPRHLRLKNVFTASTKCASRTREMRL